MAKVEGTRDKEREREQEREREREKEREREREGRDSLYTDRSSNASRAHVQTSKNNSKNKDKTVSGGKGGKGGKGSKKKPEEEMQNRLLKQLEEWDKHRQEDEMHEREDKLARTQNDERDRREGEQQQKQDELEELEKELTRAIEKENAKRLRKALQHIDEKKHVESFGKAYDEGLLLLKSIERIDRVDNVAGKISQSKVSEVRSFSKPAEVVLHVMKATLLVIGHDPAELKDWGTCQKEIIVQGKDALHKSIERFDPVNLDVDTANRGLAILDKYESRKAYDVCEAAGVFYDWTAGVCEKRVLSDRKATEKRKKDIQKQKDAAKQEEEKKKKEQEQEQKKNNKK